MEAGELGADYVAFGAFFPTDSKETIHRAGPEILAWWNEMFEIPSVAIGGITSANCAPLVQAGADFLAVIGAVWNHPEGPAAGVLGHECRYRRSPPANLNEASGSDSYCPDSSNHGGNTGAKTILANALCDYVPALGLIHKAHRAHCDKRVSPRGAWSSNPPAPGCGYIWAAPAVAGLKRNRSGLWPAGRKNNPHPSAAKPRYRPRRVAW